jgi:alpha-D-ribose 1-methylphosphonate 5-triphosphate synthase subunit PhnH
MSANIHAAGFENAVLDAQAVFRIALDVLARPGTVQLLPADAISRFSELPCNSATAALLLTLADPDTPVQLGLDQASNTVLADWLAFHCGAPVTQEPSRAAFAVVPLASLDSNALFSYAPGDPDYPDRATTVICEVAHLEEAAESLPGAAVLTGPGIRETAAMVVEPDPTRLWLAAQRNHARFPLGPDTFLTTDAGLAGLPRSTRVAPPASEMAEAG